VITTGVYGWVRHPMYLGATLMFVGGPLVAGSLAALAVGLALVVLLAVRSLDEEALLTRELTGYEEYRRRVPYRLIPYVW
jgi:protein-S-isoprenylcysteine O-methyltransferase Ste14